METGTDQRRMDLQNRLLKIIRSNSLVGPVLARLEELKFPNAHLCAGCLTQSVWNSIFDLPDGNGIGDIDLIYFDNLDLSEDGEEAAAQRVREMFCNLPVKPDVKNEARVHLWYEAKFGKPIQPFRSIEHAVSSFPTTATAIAISTNSATLNIVAPFGLSDLFKGIVRPNKAIVTEDVYVSKTDRWRKHWPHLTYLPWQDHGEKD